MNPAVLLAITCLCAAVLLDFFDSPSTGTCDGGHVLGYGVPNARIEDAFAAQGVMQVDGVDYRLSDGIFRSQHGVRAWVAVKSGVARASQVAPRLMLLERDGQIFCGTLHALASQHGNTQ
ncbi:hypothetical protein DIC66_07120 [Rhodoferax lacus]|uniref:Uncharacterized protein n=1 Tax=Rhodoferax lacus TaxID=2184758 RepID=A0A3E1RE27_9BURK|nr:hypothetical protein [Rhodoferax lacus]RFO97626.1 hypothetical protein DIC66_07120 [Rhodoferax lacus]